MRRTPGPEILTTNQAALPPPSRLESTLERLESAGDLRTLIGVVEAWHELGEPTRAARVAEARAFLDLCMTDRAWIRLKELSEEDGQDVQVLELTARMFIRRGWPNRARKPLEQALAITPDNAELAALLSQVEAAQAKDAKGKATKPEEGKDAASLLRVAETFLATGSLLKGRALLERLRRDDPDNQRVQDLLWVLDGDFSLRGTTLSELAEASHPDLSTLADLGDEAEHTESVGMHDLLRAIEAKEKENQAFPSLFRSSDTTHATNTDTDEVTRATSLADLGQLRESVRAARKSAGHVSGEEDTQIRRIIRRDDGVDVTDAGEAMHVGRATAENLGFDLDAYRASMGMDAKPADGAAPPRLPASDLDDPLEEEDDDLIVLTRREQDPDLEATVLEPDPTSESAERPDAVRFLAEAERQRQLESEQDTEIKPLPSEAPTPAPRAAKRARPRANLWTTTNTPVWLLVLAILLGIAAFFMALIVMYQVLTS